ncbi:hypothetical protein BCIN_03g09070 [Botrytis cinerea B05.10]|uniref:Uncharacterized protein n=1 Tax=Botryotinia fuckeliana (strain B05.10) TaxID=332648 RepID=A0A384JE87_BOTFB|nr:hypothetical protein BCIN_03g09070 [Botrytis cinerea B05.10]ATZ48727.1 hypothetical protein BCIN_03g09070 [Botrytis cinerea B05.10]
MDQIAPSPVSTPSPFLSLPLNARQNIYKILLCTVEDPPEDLRDNGCTLVPIRITKLQHDIYPQILRTCRKINHEATVIMRQTNLFVMVTGVIRLDEPRICFFSKYIPMVRIKTEQQANDFQKACVMTHELGEPIKTPGVLPDEPYKFMLLHRHLPLLCAALVVSAIGTLPYCDETSAAHIVTILEAYDGDTSESSLLPEKSQETLIAPYRSAFKGFTGFQLKGNISDDLKYSVISGITWAPQLNSERTIHGLQSMEARGKELFARGGVENANQIWCQALMNIRRILTMSKRKTLHETHEPDFIHQLMNMYFDLSSDRLQYIINAMQMAGLQQRKALFRVLSRIVDDPFNMSNHCSLKVWAPLQHKLAEFRYREAVGCRLAEVSRATEVIEEALKAMPTHPEFLEEQKRIRGAF